MKTSFDVDIDFSDRLSALSGLTYITASIDGNEKHNSGVYFQNIPCDPFTNISTIDYKEAETLGYFKVDFLNVGVYNHVRDEEHLINLMQEPDWGMLKDPEIVKKIYHIGKHYNIIRKFNPTSVYDLAVILALIRPSKKHLIDCRKEKIMKEIWEVPEDGAYHFKKSHAISYAMLLVVQMNLLKEDSTLFD